MQKINERMKAGYKSALTLPEAVTLAVGALAGPDRTLTERELEVAVLRRGNGRRTFERIQGDALTALLPLPPPPSSAVA